MVTSRAGSEAKYGIDRVQNESVSRSCRINRRVGVATGSKLIVSATRISVSFEVGIGNIRERYCHVSWMIVEISK